MTTKQIKIGLFGYGVVGKGFHQLALAHPDLRVSAKRIVIKNEKKHCLTDQFSAQAKDILKDAELTTVVEVINNSEDAYQIATQVLSGGNTLITANKKMLAEHFSELLDLENKYRGRLLYEASSAASIPIIRILDEYFANEELRSVAGILNGTCNYILSGIFNNNLTYKEALSQAQEKGFAEADPTLDIESYDALHKLVIINAHAFGVIVKPADIFNYGISNLNEYDITYARKNGFTIKQVSHAAVNLHGKLMLYVAPQFVKADNPLYHVQAENNGITVDAVYSGRQFYSGKGAGGNPTGAAVMADVISSGQNKYYGYSKLKRPQSAAYDSSLKIRVYVRYPRSLNVHRLNIKIQEQINLGADHVVIGTVSLNDLKAAKTWLQKHKVSLIVCA